ncbi:arsenic resistance protein [Bacillus mycoides]|uniref:Arsenic resistance protein n=1 Tax=Bacillus proteolyticus TaxID=2026192 RepID=A0AA44R7M1_9BACI|nr:MULTISPECIES: bile acid:sodium symporter [Bacillus]MED1509611.1 arsenic resistance protein [Bacillus proteolyticus]OJD72229.1 arsenic resistance protein [Bacillus sp. NH11B]OJE45648.1 arsenic resistance protein [Bacillus proteolyticus]GLV63643.1 arsenic resistance protein [Bacillus mycoides]
MSTLEKIQTFIILAAVIFGVILGQFNMIHMYSEKFIVPFLFLMLYGLFLSIPLKDIKNGFRNLKFAGTSLGINFIWTPLLAWGLGALFLSDHPALWVGFIMLMVTPCTDWYLIFTEIAKGNVALSTSILPVNLILQVLLLPIYLFLFAGVMKTVAVSVLVESIVIVIVLPFLLAHATKFIMNKMKKAEALENKIIPFFSSAQIVFLSLAIVAMFASQGKYLLQNMNVVLLLLIPVLLFFMINFILGQFVGRMMYLSYEDTVSLSLTTLARNSPVALAIAVTAFPDEPLIALALVIGPLIELPVLACVSQVLLLIKKKRQYA